MILNHPVGQDGESGADQRRQADLDLLEAIAEIASGAAHELNNPLAIISGRAQLMREKSDDPKARDVWNQIISETSRISDIITLLMEFGSPPPPSLEVVDLQDMLKDVSSASEQVSLDGTCDESISVLCDRRQLRYSLDEVIKNGIAAGEAVSIEVSIDVTAQGNVEIVVTDDGDGINSEIIDDIFTPFFSYRSAGRSTGLGLSVAWRYITMNGGDIKVSSEPGRGTVVRIIVPVA